MSKLRIAKIVLLIVAALLVAAFLHFNLPRTAVVTIEGTDVKRSEKTSRSTKAPGASEGIVTDVRYINTLTRDNKVFVLRNEDTGWGWPPYFKFNSADVTAEAPAFAKQQPSPTVLVTFYGWRIQLFSMYPNIIKMRAVPPDYSHFPWFNIILLVLLGSGLLYLRFKLKRLYRRIRERFSSKKTPPAATGGQTTDKG
jgi:hypothetical protein